MSDNNLTEGKILPSLTRFALPVLLTLFLQALYGGVDLLVVGQFAGTVDVSGVATGGVFVFGLTMVVIQSSVGVTVVVGQKVGAGDRRGAGQAVKAGVQLFTVGGLLLTVFLVGFAEDIAGFLQAPPEAFAQAVSYIMICGFGALFTSMYNLLGAIFRAVGDAKTPLYAVSLAGTLNVVLDLILVAQLRWGAAGAAWATILSQGISVVLMLLYLSRQELPFDWGRGLFYPEVECIKREILVGLPVAVQELLVSGSFMFVQVIVNTIGLNASAGYGISEKVCGFIMLVPSAYAQSMSAFVAQNIGAQKPLRAQKALWCAIGTSFAISAVIGWFTFFHGDLLARIFVAEAAVIHEAHLYLKAYALDAVCTSLLFCFIGYFNGWGYTLFVMVQGIVGSLLLRAPLTYYFSTLPDADLFSIGLACPMATVVQITMCLVFYFWKRQKGQG